MLGVSGGSHGSSRLPGDRVFPNCTARPGGGKQLVGPQLLEAANVLGLTVRRPIERGYLTNPDLQVRSQPPTHSQVSRM